MSSTHTMVYACSVKLWPSASEMEHSTWPVNVPLHILLTREQYSALTERAPLLWLWHYGQQTMDQQKQLLPIPVGLWEYTENKVMNWNGNENGKGKERWPWRMWQRFRISLPNLCSITNLIELTVVITSVKEHVSMRGENKY